MIAARTAGRFGWRGTVAAGLAACAAITVSGPATAADDIHTGEKLIGTFQIEPRRDTSGSLGGGGSRSATPVGRGERAVEPAVRPPATAARRTFLTGSAAVSYAIDDIFRREVGDRVFFGSGSAEFGTRARTVIEHQAEWLKRNPHIRLTIEGHADDGGTAEQNTRISLERAEALRDRLIEEGIEARRIAIVSRGREDRIAVCADPACAAQNRRVVVVVHASGAGERIGFERGRVPEVSQPRPGEADGRQRVPVPR